ncbi:hypothetical protein DQ04_00921010 [Trypanosoma grayi]|uniref:hypothetical protein n=1 Tax=Trypanosoma grayi TaxID=71804 RepID=UPI0004F47344|nr:hypothetical protein DQ04_00921010 [Trypanosoma grayi]KEG13567.1 hypothetical protein DQ04_00921010 [Trypanosoma grayi]
MAWRRSSVVWPRPPAGAHTPPPPPSRGAAAFVRDLARLKPEVSPFDSNLKKYRYRTRGAKLDGGGGSPKRGAFSALKPIWFVCRRGGPPKAPHRSPSGGQTWHFSQKRRAMSLRGAAAKCIALL